MKLTLPRADVRVLVDGPGPDGVRAPRGAAGRPPRLRSSHARQMPDHPRGPQAAAPEPDVVIQTSDNTCDVRGLRVDDAWPMLETFLDRGVNSGLRVAFVVHGHGTGALREHLREQLKKSRYVARIRSGNPSEGGEGVTLVWLA